MASPFVYQGVKLANNILSTTNKAIETVGDIADHALNSVDNLVDTVGGVANNTVDTAGEVADHTLKSFDNLVDRVNKTANKIVDCMYWILFLSTLFSYTLHYIVLLNTIPGKIISVAIAVTVVLVVVVDRIAKAQLMLQQLPQFQQLPYQQQLQLLQAQQALLMQIQQTQLLQIQQQQQLQVQLQPQQQPLQQQPPPQPQTLSKFAQLMKNTGLRILGFDIGSLDVVFEIDDIAMFKPEEFLDQLLGDFFPSGHLCTFEEEDIEYESTANYVSIEVYRTSTRCYFK